MSYFTVNSPVVFRLSMSRKMKNALEIIDELIVEMHKFQFLQHAEAPSVDRSIPSVLKTMAACPKLLSM